MQRFIYPLEFCEHYEIEICYGAPEQEKQEAVDWEEDQEKENELS